MEKNKKISPLLWWDNHEALKREYCKMLESHVLLIEMLYNRDQRIMELEQELAARDLKQ